jgi:hypothetical protein
MLRHQPYYLLLFILVVPFIWLSNSGCWKEYSFEKKDSILSIPNPTHPTPVPSPATNFSSCSLCNESDTLKLGQWAFKAGNTYMCGSATSSGFMGSYQFFTLFGPSACSIDTGLVINVLVPVPLTQDRFDINATEVDFYYYTRFSQTHLFNNRVSNGISVSLQSYIHSTSIAIGSFSGFVNRPNGEAIQITNGRFKVEMR